MTLTVISIKLGRTYNLGNYNHIRPEITVTAELDETDSFDRVQEELTSRARQFIQAEIDQALEEQDRPPKFYSGPRYGLLLASDEKVAALVPADIVLKDDLDQYWTKYHFNRRIEIVLQYFDTHYRTKYEFIDCRDGDLNKLPDLQMFNVVTVDADEGHRYLLVLNGFITRSELPGRWSEWWNWNSQKRQYQTLLADLTTRASKDNDQLIDCTDNDFTKLPDLPDLPDLPPEENVIPDDEAVYDDYDDYEEDYDD